MQSCHHGTEIVRHSRPLVASLLLMQCEPVASIAGVAGDISDGLWERLRAVDLDPLSMFAFGRGPWEVWLLLRRR